ncbi:MAG: stage II sporulation protein D [Clostridia bacterium]|nr:stage II sporulation protein D [Clostridia bacterium]
MRKVIITGFIVALSLLIIPLCGIKTQSRAKQTAAPVKVSKKAENEKNEETKTKDEKFLIKTESGTVELSAKEYISGVLAAEMPVGFDIEALKAQSVAAYTFALYRKGEKRYKDYDLTDSYKTDQSYISEEKRKEIWGDSYAEKNARISEAAEAVAGEYLSYADAPALTLYHALSSGITNNCEDVFGSKVEYLTSVDSESDKLSPDYKSVFSFSNEELKEKLSLPSVDGGITDIKTAKSGLVLSLKIGEKKFSGGEISGLLNLPSAAFGVEQPDGGCIFTCIGRGHGVGMSQYGANAMAQGGADYKEILYHYFPGTKLKKQ